MSRKTRKLKNKLLVPFEWVGIALALCIIPWLSRRALGQEIVRRHPSCWILNYNYFSTMPTPKDLQCLVLSA